MPPIISKREDLSAFYRMLMKEPLGFQNFLESYAQVFCNQLDFQWGHMHNQVVYLFCGTGLNGQYGLALAKELAHTTDKSIEVYVYTPERRMSEEFSCLLEELTHLEQIKVRECDLSKELLLPEHIRSNDLLIDALVGYEQESEIPEVFFYLFDAINKLEVVKVSIEVPSGISFRDDDLKRRNSIVKADYTYAIALPSLKMFLHVYKPFFGLIKVLKLASYTFKEISSDFQLVEDDESIGNYSPIRSDTVSKAYLLGADASAYGHLLLGARAVLYSGARDLMLLTNEEACLPLQMQEPELRVSSLANFKLEDSPLAISSNPIQGGGKRCSRPISKLLKIL